MKMTTKTIGQSIDEKVKVALGLYESFKKNDSLKKSAVGLAQHDLRVELIIAEMAFKELNEKLSQREGKEVD